MSDKAQCIFIMPDWPTRKYWPQVQLLKRAEVFFQPGTQLFELDGKHYRGTRWGTWAYWLDGSLADLPPLGDASSDDEEPTHTPLTTVAGITVEKEMKGPDVDALRAALHATYDGVVLCEEIKPNHWCEGTRRLDMLG